MYTYMQGVLPHPRYERSGHGVGRGLAGRRHADKVHTSIQFI